MGLGYPVDNPSQSERLVNVPGGFVDEFIKEEHSLFIRKVLDMDYLITSHNLNN
jgi:hypothetical protein